MRWCKASTSHPRTGSRCSPCSSREGELNAFGEELEIKEVLMKARGMKSSKYKKKMRSDSSQGIHPSLLVSSCPPALWEKQEEGFRS